MNREKYTTVENYMLECMKDSAHDKEHIYRVLYNALIIADTEKNVDYDVLICACLLHDIGRPEQYENPALDHALIGAEKSKVFLAEKGFDNDFIDNVVHCIQTHRYRQSNPPKLTEAKILFDADKIDATGTLGIARTLFYKGIVGEPLYSLLPDGRISDGTDDSKPSFFQEYKYKLEKLYAGFYTAKGNEIAKERQKSAVSFYNSMLNEANSSYVNGINILNEHLRRD